jgi:hypothetical protein
MEICITFGINDTIKATELIERDELLRKYLTYVSDRKYAVETNDNGIISEISRKFTAYGIKHKFYNNDI